MDQPMMSRSSYLSIAVALGIIGVAGFTMNFMVVVVIVKDSKTLWTPINVIILNLVVGDALVAVLGNPIALISAVNGGWFWSHQVCIWNAFLMSTIGLASIGNLTVMAVERWLLVARPMNPFSIRFALRMAGCVWIYSLCMSVPPLVGWGSYGPEAGNVSCSVSWEVHDPETMSDSYIAFLFVFGLIVPVIVISTSYFAIILRLKRVKKRAGERTYTGSRTSRGKMITLRFALRMAGCVWIYSLYMSVPPLVGWGSYGPEAGNVSCSVSWEVHDPETMSDSYIAFLFVFGLIVPVIVISTSYFAIILRLKRVKKRAGARGRREAKVTKMVTLMITAFLIAWTPYAGLAIAAQYFNISLPAHIAVLPSLLAKSSICYNPIIYAGLNEQFPRSFKNIFGIRDTNVRPGPSEATRMMTMSRPETA